MNVLLRLRGTVLGLGILAVLVIVDLPTSYVLAGSYVVAPLLTAVLSAPRRTAFVAVVTLGATAASTGFDHTSRSTVHGDVIRVVTAAVIGVIAVIAAAVRERREQQLSRMTRIAEIAQSALLPNLPSEIGGLRVASKYVSATSDAMVGGDLYEVTVTEWGTRLLVGDARGKGLDAVQRMVTVLDAFRQLAHRWEDPVDVAAAIDAVVAQVVDVEDFITALLVDIGPDAVTVVNCGHHPPLLLSPDGVRLLDDAPATLPFGLGSEPQSVTYPFNGGRILLYTDGLVEARAKRGGEFFDLIGAAGGLSTGKVDEALAVLTAALLAHTGGKFNDDVALVLIERD